MDDFDPNRLRALEITRLAELAELAYRNSVDEGLRMKTREGWFQKYTNAVLALNQLLKDSQYRDYEKRLSVLEESAKAPRRMVWPRVFVTRRVRSAGKKDGSRNRRTVHRRSM